MSDKIKHNTTAKVVERNVLQLASGEEIEIQCRLEAEEYDVEITLTPRRWAPDGYHWDGYVLCHTRTATQYTCEDSLCQGTALRGDTQSGYVRQTIPAAVFRAFEISRAREEVADFLDETQQASAAE